MTHDELKRSLTMFKQSYRDELLSYAEYTNAKVDLVIDYLESEAKRKDGDKDAT